MVETNNVDGVLRPTKVNYLFCICTFIIVVLNRLEHF